MIDVSVLQQVKFKGVLRAQKLYGTSLTRLGRIKTTTSIYVVSIHNT